MAKIKTYDDSGNLTSTTVDVDDRVFSTEGGEHLMHEAVTLYLASRRQGTHKVKDLKGYRDKVRLLIDQHFIKQSTDPISIDPNTSSWNAE